MSSLKTISNSSLARLMPRQKCGPPPKVTCLAKLARLDNEHENALMVEIARYAEVVEGAALNLEPHLIAAYLRELAHALHTYYNAHQFIVDDVDLRDARLALAVAARQVLANGLDLLGVSAPEQM